MGMCVSDAAANASKPFSSYATSFTDGSTCCIHPGPPGVTRTDYIQHRNDGKTIVLVSRHIGDAFCALGRCHGNATIISDYWLQLPLQLLEQTDSNLLYLSVLFKD